MIENNLDEEAVANLKREREVYKCLFEEYADLEEQGLLLRLPCKVGTNIFIVDKLQGFYNGNIQYGRIYRFEISENENEVYCWVAVGRTGYAYKVSDVGKNIFLTLDGAEQKLKEMEE